ncbi:MAG: 2-hydroxyacyl-CoA dehydratase family protein [Syntrophaceticus schinkii]
MCGPTKKRADKLIEMANLLRADGVVYFNHWGCKRTLGSAELIKDMLETAGIPVLILDGDGCDRDNINDGQMSTRLQAFLEILEAAK